MVLDEPTTTSTDDACYNEGRQSGVVFIGIARDGETLEPVSYLESCRPTCPVPRSLFSI